MNELMIIMMIMIMEKKEIKAIFLSPQRLINFLLIHHSYSSLIFFLFYISFYFISVQFGYLVIFFN